MIRLTEEHWGRIRKHFPEEQIPDRKQVSEKRRTGGYFGGVAGLGLVVVAGGLSFVVAT